MFNINELRVEKNKGEYLREWENFKKQKRKEDLIKIKNSTRKLINKWIKEGTFVKMSWNDRGIYIDKDKTLFVTVILKKDGDFNIYLY